MNSQKQLIIVNGKDRTDSVASYRYVNGKCNVVYSNSPKVYSYNSSNVRLLQLRQMIDPASVIVKAKGSTITNIDSILDFGDFVRIVRTGRKELSYRKSEVEFTANCLANASSRELFDYFKETAAAVSLVTDNGINILSRQYDKVTAVEESTVLSRYLNTSIPVQQRQKPDTLIYPFGLNQSQRIAVENAFSSQISIIQGPPGTGKTQTILNIVANAVRNRKTVAVVSNNNSATLNVAEKLEKQGLSFLTAFLGSLQNKSRFLEAQTGIYPDMGSWHLERNTVQQLSLSVRQLTEELNRMLDAKNRIAAIDQELLSLTPEQFYFNNYYSQTNSGKILAPGISALASGKLINLWLEYEHNAEKRLGFFKRMYIAIRFSRAALALFNHIPEDAIPFIQDLYYKNKLSELQNEKQSLEDSLRNYRFDAKMEELRVKSMRLFKAELAQKYDWKQPRVVFEKSDFRGKSDAFNKEYPVILSTTYSIKGTLSTEHVYDYLIVDEASQVDLATGVLAFSCAKNIIIVGDQKQLPNVLQPKDIKIADAIWSKHHFDERYHFATHSMLASAAEIWKGVPSVLLREHYRCHPKIAGFFNQKFYNGELIVMTKDHGEKDVLSMYRTVDGNHARKRTNLRQIDVIEQEVLPTLLKQGYKDIGIITPYKDQVSAIKAQLGTEHEIATVHKFQGREKDAIILTSVDNDIGEFVDNPNMLNVAVSRAVKSLSVVISNSKKNDNTNYGDLARYIEYNNFQIIDSQVYSVFDLLYKGYAAQRMQYLKKHKRVSEYDSENLAHSVIAKILQMQGFSHIDQVMHSSLSTLVKDFSTLTAEETKYAANPLTHIDFLLFNRMDKSPVMAIEIDGTRYHAEGSRQAERDAMKNSILQKCNIPLLRIRTNESGVRERIISKLSEIIK